MYGFKVSEEQREAEAAAASSAASEAVLLTSDSAGIPADPTAASDPPVSPAAVLPTPALFSKPSQGSNLDLAAAKEGPGAQKAAGGGFVLDEAKPCGVETFLLLHDRCVREGRGGCHLD